MEPTTIVNSQQAWLQTLQTQLAVPDEAGFRALSNARDQQEAALTAGIAALTRQKESAMQRFDAAIAQQQQALAALQAGDANHGRVLEDVAPKQ